MLVAAFLPAATTKQPEQSPLFVVKGGEVSINCIHKVGEEDVKFMKVSMEIELEITLGIPISPCPRTTTKNDAINTSRNDFIFLSVYSSSSSSRFCDLQCLGSGVGVLSMGWKMEGNRVHCSRKFRNSYSRKCLVPAAGRVLQQQHRHICRLLQRFLKE